MENTPNQPGKYAKYNWKQINITATDREKLYALVAHNTTDYSKGIMSTILSRLIKQEYYRVFAN